MRFRATAHNEKTATDFSAAAFFNSIIVRRHLSLAGLAVTYSPKS